MTFYSSLIPAFWYWLCWPVFVFALAYGIWRFPVRAMLAVPLRQHLLLGSTICLFLIWKLAAGLQGHYFELHLFAVTAVVMLIGVSPALISSALALVLLHLLNNDLGWSAYGVNFVLGLLVPILVTAVCMNIIGRLPQRNPFAFMLGCGFVGAILARLISGVLVYLLLLFSGVPELMLMADEYFPYMLLIAFPEGFVNGTLISCITVFYPHWVRSFDERRYLDDQ